jgi:Cof subfamily protein (haloacid dehalogenase superfamily)
MIYKALMLDVDGTLIPYDYNALPSDRVADAVSRAQEKVVVCLVSGRSYSFIQPVLEKLALHTGYLVVNNGANVFNISTLELLYDQPIARKDAKYIAKLLFSEHIPFYLKQEMIGLSYHRAYFSPKDRITTPYMFFAEEKYSEDRIDAILKKLSHLSEVAAYKGHHKDKDKFSLNISHVKATKLHGIMKVIDALQLKTEEIIGVGDSYNDIPLLMASGLKVAMGNAISDLKTIADYIAPSVDDDGVVDVIEKYIL